MATPYVTIVRNVVSSTQDLATAELKNSVVPVLVVAHEQTTGRGRTGNEWWQAPRGIAASLAFNRDRFPVDDSFSLAVGMTVRDALSEVCGLVVDLKWPNDIERNGRKVGGILVEGDEQYVAVGCGINLFWPRAPEPAAGLFDEDPGTDVGVTVSQVWAARILETEGRWDRDRYLGACSTIGAEVTWQPQGRGTVRTVDERGGLVVATDEGEVILRSGEVRTIRRAR